MTTYEVAIIGAGPYGLAAAAHLRAAGVATYVFGEAMEFWQRQMPRGMLLRSSYDASHISDPRHTLTLDTYQARHGKQLSRPLPLDDYVEYGLWFQHQAVPDLDPRRVLRVDAREDGLQLVVSDGESVHAKRVVIAGGISPFAYQPPQFDALPTSLASHSSMHSDLRQFAGQKVVVVGGGQSAIETAALLSACGAVVEVIMRAPELRWLRRSGWLHRQHPLRRLLYPPTDVGPPGLNQIVARPDMFRRFPRELQQRIAFRSIRPAAAGWLYPRLGGVRITTGRHVVSTISAHEHVVLTLNDRTQRRVDHVLLATGYRVDISRYPFLPAELVGAVRRVDGYPDLSPGFESSVPGLHFLGAPAAWSFGPLMRFVSGTEYAAHRLTRHILGNTRTGKTGAERSWTARLNPL